MKNFLPFTKIQERLTKAYEDSDSVVFTTLLYYGEMLIKTITSTMVAALIDEKERHKYRQMYKLVRANAIGDWSSVIEETLTGPSSHHLAIQVRDEQKELTQRVGTGNWQFEAVKLLRDAIHFIDEKYDVIPGKVSFKSWFNDFTYLRNKTRGHGAQLPSVCSNMCGPILQSISIIVDNFCLFNRPWAYLSRNLSGKYKVSKLTDSIEPFEALKKDKYIKLQNGVYTYIGDYVHIELIFSNSDVSDFFYPNGNFNDKNRSFEVISYISGDRQEIDGQKYNTPTGTLPKSETEGIKSLETKGKSFTNIPPLNSTYISRKKLEDELETLLSDSRHPIVTLQGRGGIGKTSLALSVVHSLCESCDYFAVIWLSARDIDLLIEGAKSVKPQVFSKEDIAQEFARLTTSKHKDKDFDAFHYFQEKISNQDEKYLLIIDNFETVQNPVEVYIWLDTFVRNPNKILITTRFRDFKGDFPIEVLGMYEDEFRNLVHQTAESLRIKSLITDEYVDSLYMHSDGHPYVAKILLGELAKSRKIENIKRIIATKDEILTALFERTYSGLSPIAKRIFLTLCGWRSIVPELALKSVLINHESENIDIDSAIEELARSSIVEIATSEKDNSLFISVPLSAAVFGSGKLKVSEHKTSIEADLVILRTFGAIQLKDIDYGLEPRIYSFFRFLASVSSENMKTLEEYIPMAEFICRNYYKAWLMLASLYEESKIKNKYDKIKESIRNYLQQSQNEEDRKYAWKRLADISRQINDTMSEVHSLVEICEISSVNIDIISSNVNRINSIYHKLQKDLDKNELKLLLSRLINSVEKRIDDPAIDANDFSRFGWLYLLTNKKAKAKEMADRGLKIESFNIHCLNLINSIH